eukprot:ANDGO_07966.mRNA.1 hypothetical protein DICPUDRAFT_85616
MKGTKTLAAKKGADGKEKVEHRPSILSRCLSRNAEWNREEVLTILHWVRQLVGLFVGVMCGALPITGWMGFVFFLTNTLALVHMYVFVYLRVDEQVLGSEGTAHEGLMNAMGVFLMSWIATYSIMFGNTHSSTSSSS